MRFMQTQKSFGDGITKDQNRISGSDGLQKQIVLLDELSVKMDEYFALKGFRF